jgi:hypothetical protein
MVVSISDGKEVPAVFARVPKARSEPPTPDLLMGSCDKYVTPG